MSVDGDVAAVLAIERPARALVEALEDAGDAIRRLSTAEYPGAGWVSDNLDLDPAQLLTAVEMFREAAGDQAAADYLFYVRHLGLGLGRAACELIDGEPEKIRRAEAMSQYAATVA